MSFAWPRPGLALNHLNKQRHARMWSYEPQAVAGPQDGPQADRRLEPCQLVGVHVAIQKAEPLF